MGWTIARLCLGTVLKLYRYSFSEATLIFFNRLKNVFFSFSDRYESVTNNWPWIEICENAVLSKINHGAPQVRFAHQSFARKWRVYKTVCGDKDCVLDWKIVFGAVYYLSNVLPFNVATDCKVILKSQNLCAWWKKISNLAQNLFGCKVKTYEGTTLPCLGATDCLYSNKRRIWEEKVCKCNGLDITKLK